MAAIAQIAMSADNDGIIFEASRFSKATFTETTHQPARARFALSDRHTSAREQVSIKVVQF